MTKQEIEAYQNQRRGLCGAIIDPREWGYEDVEFESGVAPSCMEIWASEPHNTDTIKWYRYDESYILDWKGKLEK